LPEKRDRPHSERKRREPGGGGKPRSPKRTKVPHPQARHQLEKDSGGIQRIQRRTETPELQHRILL